MLGWIQMMLRFKLFIKKDNFSNSAIFLGIFGANLKK